MEEVMNFMMHAFELAQNLELELPNMANNPEILFSSIHEVEKAYSDAKERVMMMLSSSSQHETTAKGSNSSFAQILSHDVFMQKNQHAHSMDQLLLMQHPFDVSVFLENKMISGSGSGDAQLLRSKGSQLGEVQGIQAPPSRPKKSSRKNDLEKRTEMYPAPQIGNTEMPPEDGFTWRKYGQKEILGRKYPRSYYRCTHQKLYLCPAKKQVQRLDDNPNIVEVTYRGEHICHKSLTAPSSYPPPPNLLGNISTITQTTVSSERWPLAVNLDLGGIDGSGGGGSNSRFGIEYAVADMADAMFNSGSSSGNSMELLFQPSDDKWEHDEKED
ncbi:WRKY transcription factor 55 [Vicia villosa]|uniref:WRKY transcription factor 55 n=1 Tax=Vicia villosa TaxID=3911 RepID=UPI00273C7538|nr:WRKY transcription factor 55 [Vicia villosa]